MNDVQALPTLLPMRSGWRGFFSTGRNLADYASARFTKLTATCENGSCRATIALRNFASRKAGIRVGMEWYCSSPCFEAAVESRLLNLSLQQPGRPSIPNRMPLNLLLMSRGCLTHAQSIAAGEESRRTAGKMDEILVRLGYVTEQQVTVARATQAGYPVYSSRSQRESPDESGLTASELPTGSPDNGEAAKPLAGISIPRLLIEHYSMLPLHYAPGTRRLVAGFVDEIEHGLLYAIEQMTDCKAEPCFLTPADFEEHVQRGISGPGNDEVKFMCPLREMAGIVCRYAVEMEADEARFVRTRDYLWARLKSGKQELDLLFGQPRSRPVPSWMARQAENRRLGYGAVGARMHS